MLSSGYLVNVNSNNETMMDGYGIKDKSKGVQKCMNLHSTSTSKAYSYEYILVVQVQYKRMSVVSTSSIYEFLSDTSAKMEINGPMDETRITPPRPKLSTLSLDEI